MLWLAATLPELAVELISRGVTCPGPLAIVDTAGRDTRIVGCNQAAASCHVRPGMALPTALAVAPQLRCRTRDRVAEQAALERVAAWAGRFSPQVSLASNGLLLEIAGSLSLFGGVGPLCRAISGGLAELGFRAQLAVAPTPAAAWLLAQAGRGEVIFDTKALVARLGSLPTTVLADERIAATLAELGIDRLGPLFSWPRDELARRLAPALANMLDQLLGRRPDPRPLFVPPPSFEARLDLPWSVQDSSALLFAIHRLLNDLDARLIAGAQGVDGFVLQLCHTSSEATRLEQTLLSPGRDPRHWRALLQLKLETLRLERPVEALELRAERLMALTAITADLFTGYSLQDSAQLLERLQARLGNAAVHGLIRVADHRPERAWRAVAAGTSSPVPCAPPRPLWLLCPPRLLAGPPAGPLTGPERIESGWWDGADVSRDYYRAGDIDGAGWWLFQERRGARRWFLHGLFA